MLRSGHCGVRTNRAHRCEMARRLRSRTAHDDCDPARRLRRFVLTRRGHAGFSHADSRRAVGRRRDLCRRRVRFWHRRRTAGDTYSVSLTASVPAETGRWEAFVGVPSGRFVASGKPTRELSGDSAADLHVCAARPAGSFRRWRWWPCKCGPRRCRRGRSESR